MPTAIPDVAMEYLKLLKAKVVKTPNHLDDALFNLAVASALKHSFITQAQADELTI